MSQDNKSISEKDRIYAISEAFTDIEKFCLEKITEDDVNLGEFLILETLQNDITTCYSNFRYLNIINDNQFRYHGNRIKDAFDISFLGRWWQYINDWFHNKFNKVQLDLSQTEVIKRRKLSNLKDECNKFIMPRLEEAKKYLKNNNEQPLDINVFTPK